MKFKVLLVSVVMLCSAQLVYANCVDDLSYNPEYQKIGDKVALGRTSGQTFSMLANENRPTPDEMVAILKWGEERERCNKSFPTPNNLIEQLYNEDFNATQSLILDLYKGSITYSQFARQRQDNGSTTEVRVQQLKEQNLQQMMRMQQNQQQQQQGRQQQQQWQRQACLSRARNQFDVSNCNLEAAGAGLGEAIMDMTR